MSRLATYETEIVLPVRPKPDPRTGILNIPKGSLSLDILRLALEKTARDHGGTVFSGPEAFYSDCEGRRHPALFSLHTADFARGIGINIAPDGRLTFAYDATSSTRSLLESSTPSRRLLSVSAKKSPTTTRSSQ